MFDIHVIILQLAILKMVYDQNIFAKFEQLHFQGILGGCLYKIA